MPAHVPSHRPIHFDCCNVGASATVVTNLVIGLKLCIHLENAEHLNWTRQGLTVAT
jgi:hypothetical protein